MKFPQAQVIVYVTRSTHSSENMEVVKKAMEMNQDERSVFELSPALPQLAESLRESARASNGLKNDVSLNPKGESGSVRTKLFLSSTIQISISSSLWFQRERKSLFVSPSSNVSLVFSVHGVAAAML